MLHVAKIEFMDRALPKLTSDNHRFIEQQKVFLSRFSLSLYRNVSLFSAFSIHVASSFNFIDFPVTLITLQSIQERSQFHLNKLIIKGVKIIQ